MPISSAQSAEKGSWAAGFDVSPVWVTAGVGVASIAAATSLAAPFSFPADNRIPHRRTRYVTVNVAPAAARLTVTGTFSRLR